MDAPAYKYSELIMPISVGNWRWVEREQQRNPLDEKSVNTMTITSWQNTEILSFIRAPRR